MLFDAHCQIGRRNERPFYQPWKTEDLIQTMTRCGIDRALVRLAAASEYDPAAASTCWRARYSPTPTCKVWPSSGHQPRCICRNRPTSEESVCRWHPRCRSISKDARLSIGIRLPGYVQSSGQTQGSGLPEHAGKPTGARCTSSYASTTTSIWSSPISRLGIAPAIPIR